MGIVVKKYKENFCQRFDKDPAIPFYSGDDFENLVCERGAFKNSAGEDICFFTYYYQGYRPEKLILFCHGLGPGHTAYLAEIETLCRAGYRVLTLDYAGCGGSGGERLTSVNAPTRDVTELTEHLKITEEIIPVGHSLGGYTALNAVRLLPNAHKAVVISGFIGVSDLMMGFVKLRLLANSVKRYEKKLMPQYGKADNLAYLASAKDKILWIHSSDDPVVNYKHNGGKVKKLNNPNVRVITAENKKHNPQYAREALDDMNAWLGEYYKLVNEKKLVTLEEKKAFFDDKPISRMTKQDPAVYSEIFDFLES